jgi:hypothetical protein
MSDSQTLSNNKPSDSYVIEVRPQLAGRTVQAGIVVRDGGQFRFFAAADDFNALEGRAFANPKAAEQAAIRWAADQSRRPSFTTTLQQSR